MEPQNDEECGVHPDFAGSILRWCKFITREAKKNGLEPDLIAGLMVIESGGNPSAYSKDGATGLMQVMPRDGISGQKYGAMFKNRPTVAQLEDPEFNVKYGTQFLATLIKRYGSVRDGLKYYGPANYGYKYADMVLAAMKNHRK